MKKHFTTSRYSKQNTRHAKKSLHRALIFKKGKKNRNKSLIGKKQLFQSRIKQVHKYYDYHQAVVPTNFSFIENPEGVIEFINEVKTQFLNRRKVFIVMKRVMLIDNSAIVVLLSIMVRFKSNKIKFNGDFPFNRNAKNTFIESGFFETLNLDHLKSQDKYTLGKSNSIYTHAWKNVDSELGLKIMSEISPKIAGKKVVFKGLNRTLVELMQNSFNHAEPRKEGDKHWWLSVNVNESTQSVAFSFIDYGVGIFESLNNKPPDSKWFNWKKLLNLFKRPVSDGQVIASGERDLNDNSVVLKLILDGELHKTVTGQPFRGKGLPGIKQAMDRNQISRLVIVTNNVFANIEENKYTTLSHNFAGTFVYWEINKQTINHPWIQ